MTLTAYRRILLALIGAVLLGYVYLLWSLQLGENLIRASRNDHYIECTGSWHDLGNSCDPARFTVLRAVIALTVVSLLVLGILVLLARWALLPMTGLTASVGRLGPQNLGERNRLRGRKDDVVRLGDAIDAMMDRVAEGYDAQRRFAANASHELRTPLAVQRTLIEVSMSGDPSPEQLALLSRQLLSTNERNEALIEGLLVLAESDRGLASRTPQQLDRLAAHAIEQYRPIATAAGVTLEAQLAAVTVPGEAALLDRLIANLLHNAIKYNTAAGLVDIAVRAPGVLEVTNTGEPVPPELVTTLFEPFRRLSGERLGHGGGSGLGLTIARSITLAHDGRIEALARPEGGLTVTVHLPGADM